ncbi:MAG: glycerol-3-phosphate 1-O-acyltransferase PlsY [Acholeplasmatales bacterium]|nr:glycerol-3-phosphate 1-O-acyltransferase PlsY [Acholeplasmatales bacterium]
MNILLDASTYHTFDILIAIALIIVSYLIGSIPFGVVFGKLIKGVDIRQYGSKNIGTTNSIRVLGKKVGYLVFFFDVFKGMAIILLVKALNSAGVWVTPIDELWYGAAAILGHSFSIYLGFKGGKAVAVSLGVVLATTPLSGISCAIVFAVLLFSTGYVSVGSTCATLTVVLCAWLLHFLGLDITPNAFNNFWVYLVGKTSLELCVVLSCVATLIIVKHISNYKRLLHGTENSFKKKKQA